VAPYKLALNHLTKSSRGGCPWYTSPKHSHNRPDYKHTPIQLTFTSTANFRN